MPALPGCYTQGDTREEAIAMAREAVELYLESCKAHNEPTPGQPGIEALDVGVKEPAD
ncbi:MAG: type II toxin-antitoxin system HicB family antitoxin [Dehalococcoidia bacterium]|nr:type II toxin-antitoxin system HicB family antitoxin [Dehalococcoidia bacterium]